MLAKKFRADVLALKGQKPFKQGRTPYFVIKLFKNDLGFSQFGVIVPKKVLALASSRNKLRRTVLDFLGTKKSKLSEEYNYLVLASSKASEIAKDKDAIVEQLEKLIESIN